CGHAGAFDDGQGLFVGELGQEGFADAGGVGEDAAADFGEHAHGVGCGYLGDVDDFVSVEHGQVGGLDEFFDQVGQVGGGPGAEHAGGFVAQADQAGAQGVAA